MALALLVSYRVYVLAQSCVIRPSRPGIAATAFVVKTDAQLGL